MANIFKLTAGAVVTLTALYAATGYLVVPNLVKSTLEDQAQALLGQPLSVESVTFNPWNWTLSVNGIRIDGETPESPVLSLKEFLVDLSSETLQQMAPVIDRLYVDGLHVYASLDDPNIRNLAGGSETGKGTQSEKSSSTGIPNFALYDIALKNSSIRIVDKARGLDQSVTDINIVLPFISTLSRAQESAITPELSFKINGTPVVAQGSSKPFGDSLETQLNLKVNSLDIAQFARLVPALNSRSLQFDSGKLTTDLNLVFRNASPKESGKTLLSGTVSLSDVRTLQHIGVKAENLVSMASLNLTLRELDLLEKEVHIQNLTINKPNINLLRTSNGIGPLPTSASSDAPSSSQSPSEASAWRIALSSLRFLDGSLRWRDQTVRPQAELKLSHLNAQIADFDSLDNTQTTTVHLTANLLGGSVSANGSLTPKKQQVELALDAKKLNTAALSPYVRNALGLDLSGILGLQLKGRTDNGNLIASGRVDTQNLSLREGKQPLLKTASASIKLKNVDLASRRIDIEDISVKKADLSVLKRKDGLNVLNVGNHSQHSTPTQASSPSDSAVWNWSLGKLHIEDSRIGFQDQTVKPVLTSELTHLRADASNLTSKSNRPGSVGLSAHFAGGALATRGTVQLSPLTVDLQTEIDRVAMVKTSPLLAAYTGLGAKNGTLHTKGHLSMKDDIVAWKGNLNFQNFDIRDKTGGALMFWKQAAIDGLDIRTTDPLYLVIDRAVIEQPGTKHTEAVKNLAGLAGAFAALAGKDRTVDKIQKFEGKMNRDIVLENVRYVNGNFTANGVSAESLAGMLLTKLSEKMDLEQKNNAQSNQR